MVHRDLKPENIMLTKEGVVKLLDLGVAKVSGGLDSLKTQTNAVFGTPAYISPEQAIDSSTVDARADVYSLVAGLPAKPADKSLELETQDAEIQEFILRLKRRKRRHWLLAGIVAASLLAVGLLLFLLR